MQLAQFIVGIIAKVGPLLIRSARERWSGERTRNEMANLINYAELRMAQEADDEVQGFLDSLPGKK